MLWSTFQFQKASKLRPLQFHIWAWYPNMIVKALKTSIFGTEVRAESFLQEWLWFGLLHEFEIICGVPLDAASFIKPGGTQNGHVLNTEHLLEYLKLVIAHTLQMRGVPLDIQVGDTVYCPLPKQVEDDRGAIRIAWELLPIQIAQELGEFRYSLLGSAGPGISAAMLRRGEENVSISSSTSFRNIDKTALRVLCRLLNEVHAMTAIEHPAFNKYPVQSLSRLSNCINEVWRVLDAILSQDYPIIRFEIALSIEILCLSLGRAIERIMGEKIRLETSGSYDNFFSSALEARMTSEKWCPARSGVLWSADADLQYILSLLSSNEDTSHVQCPRWACSYRPQGVEQMQAKHADDCEGHCQTIDFDEVKLIEILKSGGFPGILDKLVDETKTKYEVVDCTGRTFVAISHVWSHGLGNPSRNALPLCQIQHLFRLIKAISPPGVILWIDTISVPIQLEFKRLAILKLRDVYKTASKVLVIDRHLSHVGTHWLEQMLQLRCSEWMRRLWTLQEGRLPSDLYIHFAEQAVPIKQLLSMDSSVYDSSGTEILRGFYATSRIWLAPTFDTGQENVGQRFLDLAEDLTHRSVSVGSDEPICIATLLGLALEKFHPFPTMLDIYKSLPRLPQDLIFVNTDQRLSNPGFRWAPLTFLEQGPQAFPREAEPAVLTPQGLRICKDCIIFADALSSNAEGVRFLISIT
jgi:hypothetical protein